MTTYEKERRRSGASTRTDTAGGNGENDTASLNPAPNDSIPDGRFYGKNALGAVKLSLEDPRDEKRYARKIGFPAHTSEAHN
jgi:hypothetical protein